MTYEVPSIRSSKGRKWKPEVVDEVKRKELWERLSPQDQYYIRTQMCGYSTNISKVTSDQIGQDSNKGDWKSFSGKRKDSKGADCLQDINVVTPVRRRTTISRRKKEKAAFYDTYEVPSIKSRKGRKWKPEVVNEVKRKELWERLSPQKQYHIRTEICGYSTKTSKLTSNQIGQDSNKGNRKSFSGRRKDSKGVDFLQDINVVTPVRRRTTPQRKNQKAIFFGGMLDKFDRRLYQSQQLECNKLETIRHKRSISDPPDSKAQMKDSISRRLYAKMIELFYTYSTMIMPPSHDCGWPNYQAALIIVDGYKPNPCGGGSNKNYSEIRKQPLIKFISGKKEIGEDILKKMNEGLFNVQSQKSCDKYEIAFSYNEIDANKVSFAANGQDFVSKPKATNNHQNKKKSSSATKKSYKIISRITHVENIHHHTNIYMTSKIPWN